MSQTGLIRLRIGVWLILAKTKKVFNHRVAYKVGNFLTSSGTIRVSRRVLLRFFPESQFYMGTGTCSVVHSIDQKIKHEWQVKNSRCQQSYL